MKKFFKPLKITTKIIMINNLLYILFGTILYPLVPYLLNYPPNSIDNEFQSVVVGMQYTDQFILLLILGILINCIFLYIFFRRLNYWEKYKSGKSPGDKINIIKIRDICANGIYRLIPYQVIITSIIVGAVLTLASTELMLTIKLTLIICIWVTVSDLLLFVFSNKVFHTILKESYDHIKDEEDKIIRMSIQTKIIIQCLATLLVILLMMSFFGYSRIVFERGESLKEKELNELTNNVKNNKNNIIDYIKSCGPDYFIVNEDGKVIYDSFNMSKFSLEYIKYFPDANRTYHQYSSTIEGVFLPVNYGGNTYYVGKMYQVMPQSYFIIFVIFDSSLLLLYIVIINFFSKNIKVDLERLSVRLNEIGNNNTDIGTQLPITSNDEFSDLILAYNKIQVNTDGFIKELQEKQDIIVKQGQLASIGELAGGVAHDINTPISAIKSGILMFREMLGQRSADEMELLQRMDNCADKIINIVNSMRNQIRNLGGTTNVTFKISDVINDIRIITYNEVAKHRCELIVNIEDDISVTGDPTKLGQVITNLIVNAVQAYGDKSGKVEVNLVKAPNNMAMVKITDYAGGIDDNIKPYIFKNILTTKGTIGTGLGLYLAYSVIKGVFSGDITFESEKGVGTTFYMTLPRADVDKA